VIEYELGETLIWEKWSSTGSIKENEEEEFFMTEVHCYVGNIFSDIEFDGRKTYENHYVHLFDVNNKKLYAVRNKFYRKANNRKRNVKLLLLERM